MRTMVQVQTLSGRPPDETYGPGRYSARQPEPASSREGPKGLRTLRWSKGDSNSWSRSHAALSKTLAPSIVRLRGRPVIRDQEFESFPPGKSPVRTSSNQLRNQISADDPSAGSSVYVKAKVVDVYAYRTDIPWPPTVSKSQDRAFDRLGQRRIAIADEPDGYRPNCRIPATSTASDSPDVAGTWPQLGHMNLSGCSTATPHRNPI